MSENFLESKSNNRKPRLSRGNVGSGAYLVGFTPVDDILYVDNENVIANITGAKYSTHLAGSTRCSEAVADEQTRVTVVLRGGPWKQDMWLQGDDRVTVVLENEGDFLAWEPGYSHTWEAIGDTTMLTISFQRCE